jgi:16S rRNA (adenine1518-N6/adenine1519-N6)-dimethyltransferase
MNLTSPSQVRALLAELDIRPRREWGQNFLIDANIREIILDIAEVEPADVVLEIGPGLGVLTEGLLARAGRTIAVEKDSRLCGYLRSRFGAAGRLDLRETDFLDLDADELLAGGVTKVVANLPYSVGSRILVNLLEARQPPRRIVVTVQLEVAQRLVSGPGEPGRGVLSVWAQRAHRVRIRKKISATCFYPRPEVESAIVELAQDEAAADATVDRRAFFALTKACFGFRRKQLATILAQGRAPVRLSAAAAARALAAADIEARARPEDLGVAQWCALTRELAAPGGGAGGSRP